jgi:ATP-dependent Clp protease ATP-binding subunit ClpA
MTERVFPRSTFAAVVKTALDEARRRGDRRLGTEHLLLGLLRDPDSPPARALGVDLDAARAALDALDRSALETIGLDVGELPHVRLVPRKHPPVAVNALTSGARSAINQSIKATTMKTRPTAPNHLLLALLARERPDPVAELMTRLDIDRSAVRARIDPADR